MIKVFKHKDEDRQNRPALFISMSVQDAHNLIASLSAQLSRNDPNTHRREENEFIWIDGDKEKQIGSYFSISVIPAQKNIISHRTDIILEKGFCLCVENPDVDNFLIPIGAYAGRGRPFRYEWFQQVGGREFIRVFEEKEPLPIDSQYQFKSEAITYVDCGDIDFKRYFKVTKRTMVAKENKRPKKQPQTS